MGKQQQQEQRQQHRITNISPWIDLKIHPYPPQKKNEQTRYPNEQKMNKKHLLNDKIEKFFAKNFVVMQRFVCEIDIS